ncbi:MAG: hypothetical protein KA586_09950 [Candidatus Promineofilum sp.]|nr:hypothetical protein [Promineifilum sp.]
MKPFNRLLMIIVWPAVVGLCACARGGGEAAPTLAPTALVATTRPTIAATRPVPAATLVPATATVTMLPSPTPCRLLVQPALSDAWNADELGCAITPGAATVSTAYAPFAGGQMLWRGDTDMIYVLYQDGTWASYPNAWQSGDPEFSCGEADPLTTPVRGFGRVWCDHPEVREALGAATAAEIGDGASAVQDFINGAILVAPFGRPFVFVGEDGVWRQLDE